MGYHTAGFDVVGVDVRPQPRYPFEFHRAEALAFLDRYGWGFDAIHVSPPCQLYSNAERINPQDRAMDSMLFPIPTHPDLVDPTRDLLIEIGKPWVIENVPGAPLIEPIELCGAMFNLGTYRHRLFESSEPLVAPEHPAHEKPLTKMGRAPRPGEMMHVVGNFIGAAEARVAMGIEWMTRDGLSQAIPPAYTAFIGAQLLDHVVERVT